MAKQSDKKVLDRILNYPHHEKGCSYICGPHLEPCVMVRYHDGDCECTECHPLTGGKLRQMSKQESLEAQLAQARDYCNELQAVHAHATAEMAEKVERLEKELEIERKN